MLRRDIFPSSSFLIMFKAIFTASCCLARITALPFSGTTMSNSKPVSSMLKEQAPLLAGDNNDVLFPEQREREIMEDLDMTVETCQVYQDGFELMNGRSYTCSCTGAITAATGSVDCESTELVCAGSICATEALSLNRYRSIDEQQKQSENGLLWGTSMLIFEEQKTVDNEPPSSFAETFLVVDLGFCDDGGLCSCSVAINGGVCSDCQICNDGVSFDCSNIHQKYPVQTCTDGWMLGNYVNALKAKNEEVISSEGGNPKKARMVTAFVPVAVSLLILGVALFFWRRGMQSNRNGIQLKS